MNKSINEVVARLKFLRMSLLPPYCENLDEDEKDVDDYFKYFAVYLQQSTDAARRYRDALAHYQTQHDSGAVAELLAARAQFAAFFPFCTDELAKLNEEQLSSYYDFMLKAYQADATTGFLGKTVSEYVDLLEDTKVALRKL